MVTETNTTTFTEGISKQPRQGQMSGNGKMQIQWSFISATSTMIFLLFLLCN